MTPSLVTEPRQHCWKASVGRQVFTTTLALHPVRCKQETTLGNKKSDGAERFFFRTSMLTFGFELRNTSNADAVLWMNTRGSTQIEFL